MNPLRVITTVGCAFVLYEWRGIFSTLVFLLVSLVGESIGLWIRTRRGQDIG